MVGLVLMVYVVCWIELLCDVSIGSMVDFCFGMTVKNLMVFKEFVFGIQKMINFRI